MRPTLAEWTLMKQYAPVAATNRPANVLALFTRYSAWRAANAGWQNWNQQQFLNNLSGPVAPTGQTAPAPTTSHGIPTPYVAPLPPAPTGGGATTGGGTAAAPTFYQWNRMKNYVNVSAAQRPDDVKALFQRFTQWRAVNTGWQTWSEKQFRTRTGQPQGGGAAPGEVPAGDELVDTDGDGILDTPASELPPGFEPAVPGPVTPPGVSGPTDWSGVLGIAGLPADLAAKVSQIFASTTDTNQAVALALATVRGSAWHAATFPGLNAGIQRGLFQDERGYRDYRNALSQVYRQWTGSDVDANSLTSALNEGVGPDVVGKRFEANAILVGYRPDLSYYSGAGGTSTDLGRAAGAGTAFTETEMLAFAQNQAGLGTPGGLGVKVQRAFELAQQRVRRMFEGDEATPQLALTGAGKLFSPSLGRSSRPDIGS